MASLGVGATGMLLKSVTLFLSSGRRASAALRSAQAEKATQPKKKEKTPKKKKMGDEKSIAAQNNKSSTKQIDSLKKQTHFSRQEIEALCKVYKKLLASNTVQVPAAPKVAITGMPQAAGIGEGLDRVVFRELLHNTFDVVTEEVLMDRIFCAFDKFNIGVISLEEWVCGLSVFLRGTPEEKIGFAFFVYDLNSDGHISREEMFHLLRDSLIKHPQDEDPDEGVRDLVELALRKMDYDRDGKVSFHDFKAAVTDEPLLLEAFGQCLPADGACQTFLSTLQLDFHGKN